MRVTTYSTKLTCEGKAILEKEISVNCPNIDRIFNNPLKANQFARDFLEMDRRTEEYVYMLCLNTKKAMTGVFEITHGTVNRSYLSPREVYQKALLANAVGIILIHNHPSGNCAPSNEDRRITKQLTEAGKLLNIDLVDHVIIGDESYYSFKEEEAF